MQKAKTNQFAHKPVYKRCSRRVLIEQAEHQEPQIHKPDPCNLGYSNLLSPKSCQTQMSEAQNRHIREEWSEDHSFQ